MNDEVSLTHVTRSIEMGQDVYLGYSKIPPEHIRDERGPPLAVSLCPFPTRYRLNRPYDGQNFENEIDETLHMAFSYGVIGWVDVDDKNVVTDILVMCRTRTTPVQVLAHDPICKIEDIGMGSFQIRIIFHHEYGLDPLSYQGEMKSLIFFHYFTQRMDDQEEGLRVDIPVTSEPSPDWDKEDAIRYREMKRDLEDGSIIPSMDLTCTSR